MAREKEAYSAKTTRFPPVQSGILGLIVLGEVTARNVISAGAGSKERALYTSLGRIAVVLGKESSGHIEGRVVTSVY